MSITSPIPDAARPIVEAIRAGVDRPEPSDFVPWSRVEDGTELRIGSVCPMGMLPSSMKDAPASRYDFDKFPFLSVAVEAFFGWWDAQTDAEAAVQAVWGKEDA